MDRFLTCCLLIFALSACETTVEHQISTLVDAPAESVGLSSTRLARLDSAMNDWVEKKWVNGSVALIARKGKVAFHKAYGYNDLDTGEPLDKNGIFRIASQTKAVTSVAVMMLWEEGKFALNDPVAKFIPSFKDQQVLDTFEPSDTTFTTIPAQRDVTIRDLLTHTSGIGYTAIGTAEATAIYGKHDITGGLDIEELKLGEVMSRLGALPLMFQPGEKWMYGLNTDVLGYLVELWSGKSLEAFFTERIFQPLGMSDTHFNVPVEKASRLVNFFLEDSTGIKKQEQVFGGLLDMNYPLQPHSYFSGGAGLSSTIFDYAVFLQMLLNGGAYNGVRLLSRNTVRMMTMNQIGDLYLDAAAETKFSFGFRIITEEGSRFTPSQAGTYSWGGIFSTTYWVDPREDMVVLLYRQMWGPHMDDINKEFRPLVYQAIND